MSQALQEASSCALLPSDPPKARRESALRLRRLFLRHYRDCGDVRQAAASAGIGRSTIYRWRQNDAEFRARWDSCDDQLRFDLQGRLFALVREGEKTAVFHKGERVGWRESFTARPVVALLAMMDRERKMRQAKRDREEERGFVSHSSDLFEAENGDVSEACDESDPRKTHVADEPESSPEEEAPAQVPHPRVTSAEEREAQEWGECVYRAQLAQQEAEAAGRSPADAHEFVPRTVEALDPTHPPPIPTPTASEPGGPYRLVESMRGPHMLHDDSRRSG